MASMPERVAVVVVGDLGRSPRMQWHACALADAGCAVDLIGLEGSPVAERVAGHSGITCVRLAEPAAVRSGLARYVGRALQQWWQLGRCLLRDIEAPEAILVQTPPALPTLWVAKVAAWWRGARLFVDWHNFSHTVLALELGDRHRLVRALAAIERRFGRAADAHFCVSQAMRERLRSEYGVADPVVLYDRPALALAPPSPSERRALRQRLGLRAEGPLLVTSTSWTRDEDLDLLLDAAIELESRYVQTEDVGVIPPTIVITGVGPLRDAFEERLRRTRLQHVDVRTMWLSWDDYPRLLAAADLGISLHRSSSGVDLPMKILDMFGCGLPVCAFDYGPAIRELVHDGDNGILFRSAAELAQRWASIFGPGAVDARLLENLRAGAAREATPTWHENWERVARSVFERRAG